MGSGSNLPVFPGTTEKLESSMWFLVLNFVLEDLDQQHQQHVGAARKCRILDPVLDLLNQILDFSKMPGQSTCTIKSEKH